MSTPFYDLASLVVVPSGVKAQKVYAQKPMTTDGQLTFGRASTATRVNASGLIETVASNVPRLDYLGSTCPKLQLEPSRTNLALHSSAINNAAWVKVQVTLTANVAVSPDGTTNAEKIAINSGISGGYVYQSIATTSSTVYTSSFFIKAAGVNFTKFYSNVTGSYFAAVINLTTGAITNSDFAVTPTATNYGNGWWRVSYTETSGGGSVPIYVDAGSTSNGGAITGNGTDGILIWGAQVEAGAYATSYVPTTTAAVTRLADACSKTGISSLIGQTEGTLFVEMKDLIWRGSAERLIGVSDGTTQNRIILVTGQTSNTLRVITTTGNVLQNSTTVASTFGDVKMAFAYSSAGGVVYVNGNQVLSFGGISVPACSAFYLQTQEDGSSFPADGKNAQALLFKTRLTNAQLAELTSL
jgi:hypothetical protein